MRTLFFLVMFLFSFTVYGEKKLEQPLEELTFLISNIDDGDAFYRDLFSGTEKFREEGKIKKLNIISYEGKQEKLETEFEKALVHSDAIITDLLGIEKVEYFAKLAYEKDTPLVFAFVKPSERILDTYPNIFYIAQDELQSGVTQGLLVSNYINHHPNTDKNKDKKINILNIAGFNNGTDEWRRFHWQLNTINNYPGSIFRANELINFSAFYNHDRAYQYLKDLIAQDGQINDVEVIITQSNNMAKGVIEALAGTKYEHIPIFSRGRTPQGDEYILQDKIIGTVQSPPNLVGYYAARLAYNYINHLDINTDIPYLVYKKKVELPYEIITKENLLNKEEAVNE